MIKSRPTRVPPLPSCDDGGGVRKGGVGIVCVCTWENESKVLYVCQAMRRY